MKSYVRQPLIIRMTHWPFSGLMMVLVVSGFYLHAPPGLSIPVAVINIVHQSAGYLAFGLFIARVYWGLQSGDYRNILFTPDDARKSGAMLRYALMRRNRAPHYAKYNPLQKMIYSSWAVLFLVKVVLGFVLLNPPGAALVIRVIGLNGIRMVKYYLNIVFMATIFVHIYLSVTVSFENFRAMWTGHVSKREERDPVAERKGDTDRYS